MYISKPILFLAGLLVVLIILFTCNHLNPPPVQGSSEQIDTLVWVNDAGDIVSSVKGTPDAFAVVYKKEADSIAKVFRVKEKNLLEYIVALEHTNTDLLADVNSKEADYYSPVVHGKDTCPPVQKNLRQTFSSPYYIAKAQLGDSPYLHFEAFDTVTVLWKKVKEGNILNREIFFQLDVSTANPDTKVSGIKAYRIYEKPKKWAIGGQIGYGFSNSMKSFPYIGIGISYNPIRF